MEEYSVIGKRVPRIDAKEKVMGQAKYAADYSLPDMLWCKVVRSPYPHARILNIDTSRALRLPGVKAVVTGKDFGGWTWGFMATTRDEPPLAVDKVRYMYEAVAAVAAIDEETAEEACELIKVDYEELPGVFLPEDAMKEGAPVVHDYRPNNVSVEYHWKFGDVEKAFADSYVVREDRFETGKVVTGFLEPPASLAYYDPSGSITVWAAKQSPYFHYRHLAGLLQAAPQQGEDHSAFHRRRFRRHEERLGGGRFLRGHALEDDRKTGQIRLSHGRGPYHVPQTTQHDHLQQDGHDEGRHSHRHREQGRRQRRRLHGHRSPHHVSHRLRHHHALQSAQLQVRRMARLYQQSRLRRHARPRLHPYALRLRHSDGTCSPKNWGSISWRSGCATPSTTPRKAASTARSTASASRPAV